MSLDLEQWIYDQIVLFNKKQRRKDLGEEWTSALEKFKLLIDEISLLNTEERNQLKQTYCIKTFGEKSRIQPEDGRLTIFFSDPSLNNFEEIIAMYTTDNDAKNLAEATSDIRKFMPPKASEQ